MLRRFLIGGAVVLSFVLTAAVLAYHYRGLPPLVPLMVSPGGQITRVAPKSPLAVFRLWLMGVDAELLCVTFYRAVRRNPDGAPPVVRSAVELTMFLIAVKWVGTVFTFLDQALGSKRLHGAYVATSLLVVIADTRISGSRIVAGFCRWHCASASTPSWQRSHRGYSVREVTAFARSAKANPRMGPWGRLSADGVDGTGRWTARFARGVGFRLIAASPRFVDGSVEQASLPAPDGRPRPAVGSNARRLSRLVTNRSA